jgi:ribosome recycling factor
MVDRVLADAEERMKHAVEAFRRELASIRTGRANPALLDRISVDYMGTMTPLKQVATISVPESRLLVIVPWDKSLIGPIRNAITQSDLGLNPLSDGQVLRIPIPALTGERRRELARVVGKKAEEGKVAVRNVRRDAVEAMRKQQKAHEVSEDEVKRAQDRLQKITDKYIGEADKLHDAKVAEVMEV